MGRSLNDDDRDDNDGIVFPETDDITDSIYTLTADAADIASTQEDAPEARSVTSRCRIREQLERDLQSYLSHGGSIHHIDQGASPPLSHHYPDNDFGFSWL